MSPQVPVSLILQERGLLTPSGRALADALAVKQLTAQGGKASRCLEAFRPQLDELAAQAEPALRAKLAAVERRSAEPSPLAGEGRVRGPDRAPSPHEDALLGDPRVLAGLAVIMILFVAVVVLFRDNQRLRGRVAWLENDNQEWQSVFLDQTEALQSRRQEVYTQEVALRAERHGRRDAEETRAGRRAARPGARSARAGDSR